MSTVGMVAVVPSLARLAQFAGPVGGLPFSPKFHGKLERH